MRMRLHKAKFPYFFFESFDCGMAAIDLDEDDKAPPHSGLIRGNVEVCRFLLGLSAYNTQDDTYQMLFEKAEAERRREPRDIGVGGSHWSPLTTIYLFLDVDVIDVRVHTLVPSRFVSPAFRSHPLTHPRLNTLKTDRDPKTYPFPEAPSDSLLCRCQRCCPAQPRCTPFYFDRSPLGQSTSYWTLVDYPFRAPVSVSFFLVSFTYSSIRCLLDVSSNQ
ncbi:hypothetical protein BC827DRAFT_1248048 [Russula dissimulans]|nr:hypothetical protein BC827DRAFT_1248048 [Russula dissimulans]